MLRARFGGKDARLAYRCIGCSTTVIPSDASYDGQMP